MYDPYHITPCENMPPLCDIIATETTANAESDEFSNFESATNTTEINEIKINEDNNTNNVSNNKINDNDENRNNLNENAVVNADGIIWPSGDIRNMCIMSGHVEYDDYLIV
jgi:hypothetical protein